MDTAWQAVYTSPAGQGHTIGLNSEMDALPGMGHACGHNLIAVSGVAVAVALKAFLETYKKPGTIILLGTPGTYAFRRFSLTIRTSCWQQTNLVNLFMLS